MLAKSVTRDNMKRKAAPDQREGDHQDETLFTEQSGHAKRFKSEQKGAPAQLSIDQQDIGAGPDPNSIPSSSSLPRAVSSPCFPNKTYIREQQVSISTVPSASVPPAVLSSNALFLESSAIGETAASFQNKAYFRECWADFVSRKALENGIEQDRHRLAQRQKQIDYGKNTLAYDRYSSLISRQDRKKSDPMTPEKRQVCSKRSWDAQVRAWRRALHQYDPNYKDEMNDEFGVKDEGGDINQAQNRSIQVSENNPAAGTLDIYGTPRLNIEQGANSVPSPTYASTSLGLLDGDDSDDSDISLDEDGNVVEKH